MPALARCAARPGGGIARAGPQRIGGQIVRQVGRSSGGLWVGPSAASARCPAGRGCRAGRPIGGTGRPQAVCSGLRVAAYPGKMVDDVGVRAIAWPFEGSRRPFVVPRLVTSSGSGTLYVPPLRSAFAAGSLRSVGRRTTLNVRVRANVHPTAGIVGCSESLTR